MSEKKLTGLTNQIEKKKVWELIAIIIVTAIVWNLPTSAFGIDGLTVVQQRIIATFVFATLSWLTECIPAWATSLSIITIMCTTVSQNSFKLFKGDDIGELLDSEEIMASFAVLSLCSSSLDSFSPSQHQSRDWTLCSQRTLFDHLATRAKMYCWDSS